jgi:hypothetical protein
VMLVVSTLCKIGSSVDSLTIGVNIDSKPAILDRAGCPKR